MTRRQRRGSRRTTCEGWLWPARLPASVAHGPLRNREEEDFRPAVVNLYGLGLVLVPGQGKAVASRTNGGYKRPRRVAREAARRLTRHAGGVEGLEVHPVLA